jgi:hypothetical protein
MTGPVPSPLAPVAVGSVGHQPLAEGSPGPGQNRAGGPPTSATVVSITRQGPLIEAAGQRFLLRGAPPLPEGATLSLDLAGGRQAGAGRLLAIAGRALEPPVTIRLQAVPPAANERVAAESGPRLAAGAPVGVRLEARLLGPDGRPAGPPIPIRLAATGDPTPGPPGQAVSAGGALTAEVSRSDPSGGLLLRAAGLTLRLETAVDVPAGARLQLVLPDGFASRPGEPAPTPGDDAFHQLLNALLQRPTATGDAGGLAELRLPPADHALAARLLRWIETLRASPGAPDSEAGADAGGPDPQPEAGPLRSALSALGQHAREPQASGWRVLVMPLGVEDPSPLRLYLRDLPPDREGHPRPGRDRRSAAQRAVFEVELSQLGRCQLDVLCQARRFDLAVRTDRPLAAALQDDIRALLNAACEIAGVAGKVEFRVAELLTLPDPLAPAGHAWMA